MASGKVKIKVETTAPGKFIVANGQLVQLVGDGGSITVQKGEENTLGWTIVGTPGTTYKITLSSTDGTVQMASNPFNGKIIPPRTRSIGARYFTLT